MARCAVLFFQHVQSTCSFSCNLETKFWLHAAGGGGIFVQNNFKHLGGKIEVSKSSAAEHGGAVLRSPCGVWRDFEMAVGSVRSTLGSEIEKNRRDFHRFPRFAINVCDKA